MIIRKDKKDVRSVLATALTAAVCLAAMFGASCENDSKRSAFQRAETFIGFDDKFTEPFGVAVKGPDIFVSDGQYGRILKYSAETGVSDLTTGLDTPSGIALDINGDLIVADSGSNTVKRIDKTGAASVIAGVEGKRGFADGYAASSLFNAPVGIAVDKDGRIFVSDTYNDRIRVIEDGRVRTLAGGGRGYADGFDARFDTPLGIAIWRNDKLLVADAGNRRIRVIEPDGSVWTLAGNGSYELRDGFPLFAGFVRPTAVAVSPDGEIFITDGNAIRAIGRRALTYVETLSGGRRGFRDGNPIASRFNRPSGLAFSDNGELLIADSDSGLIRKLASSDETGGWAKTETKVTAAAEIVPAQFSATEFRSLGLPRWPYDPPETKRDIAGTLGEIRGGIEDETSQVWFHNGLDIAGGYGETARFVRDEKVLDPFAAENFNTLRELIRMPTLGYVHIRLGRDRDNKVYGDERFLFDHDPVNNIVSGVRVPRGAKFRAGESIGTLNAMNHVHLIAGRGGAEMNALAALMLPGISDSIQPTIDKVAFYTPDWIEIETKPNAGRIKLSGKTRVVVKAYDRMDGNPERRRLGLYRLGYELFRTGEQPPEKKNWTITFDRMPPNEAVRFVYGPGSHSGATGETIFNYIVTNRLDGDRFGESFIDTGAMEAGEYKLRVYAADFFGNTASKDIQIEVTK